MKNDQYQPVIGLEIHIELATNSKMFCGCSANHFGVKANTHCCPVCLGLPGALPVPNKKAIEWTIVLGLALGCEIPSESKFDRKNYFYPDLPKGYQISQYDLPLCLNGKMVLGSGKEIRIRRVHLEEDTGKLLHTEIEGEKCTLIDFNRSGVPLVEVVTEPDFENIEEVDEFLKELQYNVKRLKISSADMEKGSMRLEPNVSVRKPGQKELPPYKVEIKNINSFRFTRKAIEYEIKRQTNSLEKGEKLTQETRGWNEAKNETVSQRSKEEAQDYRYFPEPDIPPMSFSQEQIARFKSQLPSSRNEIKNHFINEHGIPEYNADILTRDEERANLSGAVFDILKTPRDQRPAEMIEINITGAQASSFMVNRKVKSTSAQGVIKEIASVLETSAVSDEDLEKAVNEVLAENQKAVEDFKKGKTGVLGFLIASAVKKLGPKTDRQIITKRLQEKLG
jgi:aspartyl-tRNA(Asn)/glutamyl-tRNA(Gln) amidotransferase subunit B